MSATAILAAAGTGERLGAGTPKAFVELAGRPMVEFSLDALEAAARVGRILVALPPPAGTAPSVPEETFRAAIGTRRAEGTVPEAVTGGDSRSASVRNALELVEDEIVVVHDAARPLAPPELFDAVVAALEADAGLAGVIAATPVTDTTKEVLRGADVERTLDRSTLWAAQTPQAFRAQALRAAFAEAGALADATDDAMLVERAGGRVAVHEGPAENLKVTTPADLRLAALLLG